MDIKETDSVTQQQAKKALDLYLELSNKPNFRVGPDSVKPKKMEDNSTEVISEDFFLNPQRIIYLSRWVLNLSPFLDLLDTVGKLPINRDNTDDFEGYLKECLTTYLSSIEKIMESLPAKHNLIKENDLNNIKGLIENILASVKEYFQGYPDRAFANFKEGIETFLMSKSYLDHVLSTDNEEINNTLLYKMRVGTNQTYSADEMFHIPFQLRGLVKTNRYSIPGLPCVYLGSSPLTCWEELNKPDLNTVQTSAFVVKDMSFLDLSTPPKAAIEQLILTFRYYGTSDMEQVYKELVSYIVTWPLIAACSIRVKNPNDSFKPEYIIPQLLLQWIRQSNYDGICYFSTKVNSYTSRNVNYYKNYALPVQENKTSGHCNVLKNKFTFITEAVPWQMFQLYKDSYLTVPNESGIQAELEFVNNMVLLYSATDFSKLETFLINKIGNMRN